MLEDTRNQIKLMVSSNNNEIDFKSKRLEEKNEEITQLTSSLNIVKKKLDEAQDEILQLKSNISASLDEATTRSIQKELVREVPPAKPKLLFVGTSNIQDHTNMLVNGNPNDNLLCEDKIHLNDKGISILASNIKRAIHTGLHIPLPPARPRSRSRQRPNRGRGRGRGRDYD
ncbi:Hypothetical predicted protein [Mytilus galloprovincialis]|uniref:Uncharacterized protein n=1 Tax=Mytilus galloprovincialis TaxID=29158 RepID=A0A8B6DEQ6_MYTGA|nr:Hypothetical predicted protein [Mytilus galloprovincialis]